MDFEYDPGKSAANKLKHGIDFEQAKKLWDDPQGIEGDASSESEPRHMVIGRIGDTTWTAVITYRQDVVRIISVRRSRGKEEQRYESQ